MRLLALGVILFAANAIGLVIAAWLLDDMSLSASGFLIEVAIFTGLMLFVEPFLRKLALTHAQVLLGSTAIIATLIALIVTEWIGKGLEINGAGTWVLAAIIIWGFVVIARLILPLFLFRELLRQTRERG
jgi:putative membrane protein